MTVHIANLCQTRSRNLPCVYGFNPQPWLQPFKKIIEKCGTHNLMIACNIQILIKKSAREEEPVAQN